MLIRYIRTAWRSLWVRRWYTLLNVCGLALAIGCCTLLYTYISYHLSFDDYHPKAGTTYRIVYDLHLEKTEFDKGSSYAMLNTARQQLPQVTAAGFLISNQSYIIGTGTDAKGLFREDKTIAITDADWFKLFKYELAGGSTQLLNEPNTALLTQKQAIKYFGNEQAVGQYVTIKHTSIKVVGVLKDAPYNTDLRYDVYLSLRTLPNIDSNFTKDYYTQYGYLSTVNNAYIALQNNKQKAQVEKALNQMVKAQFGDGAKYYTFKLLPLGIQHFDGRYGGQVQRSLLIILTIIGALIIVIAGINYINIMIAQQARRSVEIGTRKVLGASGSQLFVQLMFESALTTLLATALAGVLVVVALPLISRYLFVDDAIHVISYLQLGLFMTGVLIFINLLTGVYPALMLSRATIYDALKNKMLNTNAGTGRKVLVVVQNVIAQVLIACTIVIVMQVRFLKSTDKGFDRKWVITLPMGDATEQQKHLLKQSIAQMQGVSSATICLKQPSSDNQRGGTVLFNRRPDWEKWPARFALGDEDYLRTFGLKLLAGRIPHKEPSTPEFLINEKMVAMLHVNDAQEVLGRTLNAGDSKGIIVGVVKDFAVRSLLEPIEPAVILQDKSLQTNLAVKLSGNDLGGVLDHLKKLYAGVLPDQVFTYHFIDDEIAALYKAETLQQKLIWSAAIIAIIISSLGLLGIISLITFQRTKEIGVRKVLGASVRQIGMLLSAELVKMVGIALLIAVPLSWWMANAWLQNFVHHINIQWWMFLLAGSLAMLIALATVGFRALRAAVVNPVNSLRSE